MKITSYIYSPTVDGGFIDFLRDFLAPKNSGEMISTCNSQNDVTFNLQLDKMMGF